MKLHERKVLLLGATGGIGQEVARELYACGARVIEAGRHISKEPDVVSVKLDLSSDDLATQLEAISSEHPDIDTVIHCAGQNSFGSIEATRLEEIDRLLSVNLRSAIVLARHFVPRMKKQTHSNLVFVGSTFGHIGFPGFTAYCASKAGLKGFTEALRRELADTSIDIQYIAPRATLTAMNNTAVTEMNKALGTTMDPPDKVARAIIRSMERHQLRTCLGWPERFFVFMNSLLPRLVDQSLRKQLPVIRKFLKQEMSS